MHLICRLFGHKIVKETYQGLKYIGETSWCDRCKDASTLKYRPIGPGIFESLDFQPAPDSPLTMTAMDNLIKMCFGEIYKK